MPDPRPQSILCPILIGRDVQVATLARLLDQARDPLGRGHGQIALISGEAGIGKSRLVQEIVTQARQQGFGAWQGRCFETDRTLPYALLLDLLQAQPGVEQLPRALHNWLSGRRDATTGDGEESKRRWFATLAQWFSPAQPQLLVCEDLHWADDMSLEFLGFLARQVAQHPLLLLFTFRPDEDNPALTRLLALLDRQRLATELLLQPLTEQETDQMVRTLFQQNQLIRSEFLYTLHSLSEGNPFFIEEILKSLVATGDIFQADGSWTRKPLRKPLHQLRIPRTIQAAVQSRLANVSPAACQLLRLAAVAGRRFDFAILRRLTEADEPSQIELIKELISAQLVSEESQETFTFRHALTRQAIYNELLQRERTALHQAIGGALEQRDPATVDEQLANLAYHFYAAQDWEKAYHYAQRAAAQAQQVDAPRAAITHFSHAIEASQRLNAGPVPPSLLYGRAQAAERIGEFENARADYEASLAAARQAQAIAAEWQALLALGFLWTARNYQQADQYFQAALQLARQVGQAVALARTLNRVGNWYLNADEPQTALAYHHEALTLFQQAQDQPGVAETLDLLGTATYYSGDLAGALVHYQATIDLCRRLDQRAPLVSALLLWAVTNGPNYLHNTLSWPTPRQASKQQFAGLTGRGREVAALVAQGKTNLEIATALTLTERTVESHIHWTNSIQINRPIEQVYAYLVDFPRHAEWAQTVERLEKVKAGDSNGVGAEYLTHERQAMQTDRKPREPLRKGMKAKMVCVVRALTPYQRIAWHSHMTMIKSTYADWEFRLDTDGNGNTRLTQSCHFHFSPLSQGIGRLLDMERKAQVQFDAGLQNIKLILEKV